MDLIESILNRLEEQDPQGDLHPAGGVWHRRRAFKKNLRAKVKASGKTVADTGGPSTRSIMMGTDSPTPPTTSTPASRAAKEGKTALKSLGGGRPQSQDIGTKGTHIQVKTGKTPFGGTARLTQPRTKRDITTKVRKGV